MVDGLDNPICDQKEIERTRGKQKNPADYLQMKEGASRAPGYMVVTEGPKFTRIFKYGSSQQYLRKYIRNAGLTSAQINNLKDLLTQLQADLNSCPFAFIGASVIFVQQKDGSIRPILIDPAHVNFSGEVFGAPVTKVPGLPGKDIEKLYFGTDDSFNKQRQSNNLSLNQLNKHLTTDLARKPSKTDLARKLSKTVPAGVL